MKFNHMVKYGDKYYMAGEEVPMEKKDAKEEKSVETPSPSYSDSDIILKEDSAVEEKQYTKTEINSMNKAELQALAEENGVDNAYEMTGTELKTLLTNMLVK